MGAAALSCSCVHELGGPLPMPGEVLHECSTVSGDEDHLLKCLRLKAKGKVLLEREEGNEQKKMERLCYVQDPRDASRVWRIVRASGDMKGIYIWTTQEAPPLEAAELLREHAN
mmetsp:Transcript_94994/g.306704  ORF Transcript_94994/g.306704 Transcript_94994/m.306704 type:complete len:114 (+) Transcript_94994:136-477(+)